ncbi:FAD:protein FMN transferase [Dyadobacter sp. CY343]|uniref:FAD:protein FMN transferase n=1 Tax=Dyadobacter sp. CY343 TaxID=2907299 RepID=UPI001F2E3E45|nr:FAD:protein FMN transferase [Dyadobacter sp. CY343]MCE7061040.1 FAD:protein FMN transferase [Dyadobacter sp. CY343]
MILKIPVAFILMVFQMFVPPVNAKAAGNEPLISISGEAQGTTYHIKYFDRQNRNFKVQIDSILSDFDKCLSLYRKDSEIVAFNNSTGSHRFRSDYFYPVLQKSLEIYAATNGAFDPTIMPLTEALGFGAKRTDPELANVDSLLQYVGFDKINFNADSISKVNAGVRIDMNGIAQGYSVDIVSTFLRSRDINRFMVEIGGEVVCSGNKDENLPWVAGIENPLKRGQLFATAKLSNLAMTTAGNYNNHFTRNGRVFNHIINPKTGSMEETSLLSVTVFAKDAMTADGYDTAFFVMGLDATKEFLSTQNDLEAYLIYTDEKGKTASYVTKGMKDFIKEIPNP